MELLRSSLASFNQTTSTTTTTTSTIASIIIDDLLGFNDSAECREVTRLHDIGLQCEFARVVDDCYDDNKIDYIRLTYCVLESQLAATLLFIVMLAFLFLAIGTTADDFCRTTSPASPSSPSGNGAPDIFSSIIGIGNADPSMVIGQLYGGGIFVTTIVVGSILMRERFTIMHRPLLRDITFYLLTTSLVWATFLSERISLVNSCLFILIYLVYVVVVVASGVIYRRQRVIREQEVENGGVSIFSRRGAAMPRDRLKRGKKYHVQEKEKKEEKVVARQNSGDSSSGGGSSTKTSSSSVLSLKSLFSRQNSDNYEGVVLRRIKFRHYPHDPLYNRRLTAYNLSATMPARPQVSETVEVTKEDTGRGSLSKPDLVLEVEDGPAIIAKRLLFNLKELLAARQIRAKSVAAELGHHLPPPQQQLSFGKFPDKEEIGSSSDSSSSSWRWWRPALQTLLEVSHFDLEELAASSWLGRLLMVVKAPIYLVFTLTIPVVDSELPEAGWNRSLALFQLLLSPQCCLLITEMTIAPFSRLQVHLVVLAGSAIVLPLVAASSSKGSAPRYHIVFAYFGFIVAISWIYTIANEVVSLLKAIGVIFNLSQFMLGLTFLAWGNSIGDFISNLTMARNGFPRMAISACFGGPVLNMLLGVGIPYTYLLLKQQQTMPSMPSIELVYSRMISIMYGTISLSLVTTIVVLVFVTKFASAQFHGFILYGLYASFLASAIFTEIKNLS
ncbi:Mitochondrial sodium/calcium exchanger protein [Tyrophagus putrescentiae]|nr:Mitochondrial sodium/calcium exchanger protein [Tyrophagus putrescentiae]